MCHLVISYFVPRRWRGSCCVAVPAMVSFLVLVSVLKQRSEPKDELADFSYELEGQIIVNRDHLGLSYCPVCFGRNETVCEGILHNTVKILSKKETKSKKHGNQELQVCGIRSEFQSSIMEIPASFTNQIMKSAVLQER